jgi:glycosyltransferase involved in cell wall biosynthesis
LAAGLPVVAYAVPSGILDVIEHGINGFLVPPGDEHQMASYISRLLNDDVLFEAMSGAARRRSREFCEDRVMVGLDKFLISIARN